MSTIHLDPTAGSGIPEADLAPATIFGIAFNVPSGHSQESAIINERRRSALQDYLLPITRTAIEFSLLFYILVRQWRQQIPVSSSVSEITAVGEFRQIVELGWEVVPFILQEISIRPDYLISALREITGENPVRATHRGDIRLMARDWLEWAKAKGIQW